MNFALSGMAARTLLACLGLCSAAQAQGTALADKEHVKRPVTVTDAIEMTQIGDRSYLVNFNKTGNVVQLSPDGSKFAFVTQKGNLKNDTVEFSLLVFQTTEAFASPRPEVVATLASFSNREAIRQVQWLPDNETLVFLGEQPGETPQLYKVSTRTKRLDKLTNHPTPILAYSMSERGENFVYVAEVNARPVVSNEMRRRGFFVTSQRWDDLYTNRQSYDSRREIFVKTPQIKMPQSAGVLDAYASLEWMGLKISPNGKYALLRAYSTSPPAAWNEYRYWADGSLPPSISACNAGETSRCPEQFYVVDLNKRMIEPLLNTPALIKQNGLALAAWTRESSILLVNALLPLDSVEGEERNRRRNHVYAVEVRLPERDILKISERQEPYAAAFIESDAAKDRIIFKTGIATLGPALEFRKEAGEWKVTEINEAALKPEDRLSVTLDQDINSPPKLVANDPTTKRRAVVLDLNPQFSQLTFGRVEIFPWKTREGRFGEGTLYYPPDYVPGKRYPLIIQTHDERRERFWIDGPYTTAYAAQPLANRGFLVLQMGMVDIYEKTSVDELYKFFGTPQEGAHYMALFESAIDELDRRGLIDPTRIGLSGFSRTVYHVLYALTHSSHYFAAAVATDGVNFGFVGCVYYLAKVNSSLCEKMNGGGPPYGETLIGWAKEAPTFRLDRIEAPLLLQAISAPLEEWGIFSGLQWLKKPVEMLNFYPEGEHILIRPQQRLLSQGSVVDWYCFWLKGEENPDPGKAEQYVRWRKMKQERDHKAAQAEIRGSLQPRELEPATDNRDFTIRQWLLIQIVGRVAQ